MDSLIMEHRALIDVAFQAVFLGAAVFATYNFQRDMRAAWPRIVELFKERNGE